MAQSFLSASLARQPSFPEEPERPGHPDPSAESRFLYWLIRLPIDTDIAEAARKALQTLETDDDSSFETGRLRRFFHQAAAPLTVLPRRRDRRQH